jgi:hypothetical protein
VQLDHQGTDHPSSMPESRWLPGFDPFNCAPAAPELTHSRLAGRVLGLRGTCRARRGPDEESMP